MISEQPATNNYKTNYKIYTFRTKICEGWSDYQRENCMPHEGGKGGEFLFEVGSLVLIQTTSGHYAKKKELN